MWFSIFSNKNCPIICSPQVAVFLIYIFFWTWTLLQGLYWYCPKCSLFPLHKSFIGLQQRIKFCERLLMFEFNSQSNYTPPFLCSWNNVLIGWNCLWLGPSHYVISHWQRLCTNTRGFLQSEHWKDSMGTVRTNSLNLTRMLCDYNHRRHLQSITV